MYGDLHGQKFERTEVRKTEKIFNQKNYRVQCNFIDKKKMANVR